MSGTQRSTDSRGEVIHGNARLRANDTLNASHVPAFRYSW